MSIKLTDEQYNTIRPALKWDYYGMALNYLIALNCRADIIRILDIYLYKNTNTDLKIDKIKPIKITPKLKKIKEVRDFIVAEYQKEKDTGFNHKQTFYSLEPDEKVLWDQIIIKRNANDTKKWNTILKNKDKLDRTYFKIVKKAIDGYNLYGLDKPTKAYDLASLVIADRITSKSSIDRIEKIIFDSMGIVFGREEFDFIEEFEEEATYIYNKIHNLKESNVIIMKDNDLEMNISTLTFTIGGNFVDDKTYTIKDNKLHYKYHDIDKTVDINEELFDTITKIIKGWKGKYYKNMCDGEQWELDIITTDGKKINYSGSNAYPKNFDVLVEVFESYAKKN